METATSITLNGQPLDDAQPLHLAHEQLAAQQAQLDETGAAFVRVTGQLSVAQAHVARLEQEVRDHKAELVDAQREVALLHRQCTDAVEQCKRQGTELQGLIDKGRTDAGELGRTREHLAAERDEVHRLQGCWALTLQELAEAKKVLTIEGITQVNRSRSQRWHLRGVDDWSLSDWFAAAGGEAGELGEAYLALATVSKLAHLGDTVKKLNRVRDGLTGNFKTQEELRADLGKEMADAYLYLDLMAQRAQINLPAAIVQKFNEVSERFGFPERLGEEVSQS